MYYVDVRSPGEYAHAHIPGALSLPLFTNAERAEVGTLYKQVSREVAFSLALRYVAPKLASFLVEREAFPTPCTLYCWRGGMRSRALHLFFAQAGLPTEVLPGGYKAFRRGVLALFASPFPLQVVTGFTGTGKTEWLQALQKKGEQVLDLEALANHKGSAFGYLGAQPSTEQFENSIAMTLRNFTLDRPIWVEDESRFLGRCKIPDALYEQMRQAPMTEIRASREERCERLVRDYQFCDEETLLAATARLEKRLGREKTRVVGEAILRGDRFAAAELLLTYYDQTYLEGRKRKAAHVPTVRVVESVAL